MKISHLLAFVIGGMLFGFAVGFLITQNDDFHVRQLEYIDGVAQGVVYREDQKHAHNVGDPQQRCVATFYPDRPVALAGCFEAISDQQWRMPTQ